MRQQGAGSEEGVDPGMLGLWEAAVFWHEARLQHPWRLPSAVALSLTALGLPFFFCKFFFCFFFFSSTFSTLGCRVH